MSITTTTLSGACTATDTVIGVTSATGMTAPVFTTGAGWTYLLISQEMMKVEAVNGTFITVARGQLGTRQVAHTNAATVLIGAPADFPAFTPAERVSISTVPISFEPSEAAVVMAAQIVATGAFFHTTGTVQATTMTFPGGVGFVSGEVTIVFDGSGSGLTWTTGGTGVAGTSAAFAVAGTATTAGSMVTFRFDPVSNRWHPSRLA